MKTKLTVAVALGGTLLATCFAGVDGCIAML